MTHRPNPEQALRNVLAAKDWDDALARLTLQLARAWSAGRTVGFSEGMDDATLDDPPPDQQNPYRAP